MNKCTKHVYSKALTNPDDLTQFCLGCALGELPLANSSFLKPESVSSRLRLFLLKEFAKAEMSAESLVVDLTAVSRRQTNCLRFKSEVAEGLKTLHFNLVQAISQEFKEMFNVVEISFDSIFRDNLERMHCLRSQLQTANSYLGQMSEALRIKDSVSLFVAAVDKIDFSKQQKIIRDPRDMGHSSKEHQLPDMKMLEKTFVKGLDNIKNKIVKQASEVFRTFPKEDSKEKSPPQNPAEFGSGKLLMVPELKLRETQNASFFITEKDLRFSFLPEDRVQSFISRNDLMLSRSKFIQDEDSELVCQFRKSTVQGEENRRSTVPFLTEQIPESNQRETLQISSNFKIGNDQIIESLFMENDGEAKKHVSNRSSALVGNGLKESRAVMEFRRSLSNSHRPSFKHNTIEINFIKDFKSNDALVKKSTADNNSVQLTHSSSKHYTGLQTQPENSESRWKARMIETHSANDKEVKNVKSKFYEPETATKSATRERRILVGGTKGRNLLIRFLDLSSFESEKKKFHLPDVIKGGTVRFKDHLYIFGGKLGHIISDSVFQISLKEPLEPKGPLMTLSRKKYSFGFATTDRGTVYLFGGKNERGEIIDDIEMIDFGRQTSSLVGKLGCAKFGMSVIYMRSDQKKTAAQDSESEDSIVEGGQSTTRMKDCSSNIQFSSMRLDNEYNERLTGQSDVPEIHTERLKAISSATQLGCHLEFKGQQPNTRESREDGTKFTIDAKFDQFDINRDSIFSKKNAESNVTKEDLRAKKQPKKPDNQHSVSFRQMKAKDSKADFTKNSQSIHQDSKPKKVNSVSNNPMLKRPSKSNQSKWKNSKVNDKEPSKFIQNNSKPSSSTKAAIWNKIYDNLVKKKTEPRSVPEGVFYILGGGAKNGVFLSDIEIFKPTDQQLTKCGQMAENRVFAWTIEDNGVMLTFGGKSEKGVLSSIEKLEQGHSSLIGQLDQGRYAFKGLKVDGGFLALSGKTRKGITSKAEFLVLSDGVMNSVRQVKSCENIAFFDLI
jgi:hypothetical protein